MDRMLKALTQAWLPGAVPCFAGRLLLPDETLDGWVEVEDGRIRDWGEGTPDAEPVARGWIMPAPVNAHTHVADTFLRDAEKPRDVARLVGPGGWKHQQLAQADPTAQQEGVERIADEMAAIGTAAFIDFREGGVAGAQWLRGLDLPVPSLIHGRPVQPGFDEDEARELLRLVDGIGMSGMRDHPQRALEEWSEACRKARIPFAVHVSEAKRDDIDAVMALEPTYVVHMCQAKPRDLEELAAARVPIVACPRSNAWFGLRTPLAAMLDAECTVALGTDNGMLHDGDIWNEARAARRLGIRTEDVLRMAANGRRLAGLETPALRRGQPSDLVVLPPDILETTARKPALAPGAP